MHMARQILDDETKLDPSSEIYNKRTLETEKEAAKNLDKKGKLRYFKDYYLGKILFGLFILAIFVLLGREVIMKKDTAFCVVFLDATLDEKTVTAMKEELTELFDIDTDKEEIVINTNYQSTTPEGLTSLTAAMYAGQVDVVICARDSFTNMAENGCFLYQEDGTDTDFYKNIDETSQVYCVYEDGETEDPYAKRTYTAGDANSPDNENAYLFGLSLQNSAKFKSWKTTSTPADSVVGIVGTSEHADRGKQYIQEYLLKE